LEGERHDFPFITLSPLFKAACFLDDSSIFHYERSPLNGNRGNTHAISHIEKVYYLHILRKGIPYGTVMIRCLWKNVDFHCHCGHQAVFLIYLLTKRFLPWLGFVMRAEDAQPQLPNGKVTVSHLVIYIKLLVMSRYYISRRGNHLPL
jgi:hypothetical protein